MEKNCDLIKVTADKIEKATAQMDKTKNRKNGNPDKFIQRIANLQEKINKDNFKKVSVEERYAKILDDTSGTRI